MAVSKSQVVALIKERGHERREEPFQLSAGETSYDYIDGKRAIASGADLRLVCEAILTLAGELGVSFDAVGGLTMGADPLAIGVAAVSDASWFSVRKANKKHGKQKLVEGCELRPGMSVLAVDDVVSTGASIAQAIDAIEAAGAHVVLAVTLVDRGEAARELMEDRGIRYAPLATYRDLDIPPVGRGRIPTA